MKTKWIIPAALFLALTLTSTASAGSDYKVTQVGGSQFGFFFGAPGIGFSYGQSYGHRGHYRSHKPWRHYRSHSRHRGHRHGNRHGHGHYQRRSYQYSEHHYYNERPAYSAPAPVYRDRGHYRDSDRNRHYQDGPAMHMHLHHD